MIEPDAHNPYYTFGLESKQMEQKDINEEMVRKTVAFHGHMCPGLILTSFFSFSAFRAIFK